LITSPPLASALAEISPPNVAASSASVGLAVRLGQCGVGGNVGEDESPARDHATTVLLTV
jgi:hypothetical protein